MVKRSWSPRGHLEAAQQINNIKQTTFTSINSEVKYNLKILHIIIMKYTILHNEYSYFWNCTNILMLIL